MKIVIQMNNVDSNKILKYKIWIKIYLIKRKYKFNKIKKNRFNNFN